MEILADADYLKIDGHFIRNITSDPLSAVAGECFVNVATVVGTKAVAELVEDQEALELLIALGVDYSQGYFIHTPVPLSSVRIALNSRKSV